MSENGGLPQQCTKIKWENMGKYMIHNQILGSYLRQTHMQSKRSEASRDGDGQLALRFSAGLAFAALAKATCTRKHMHSYKCKFQFCLAR